MESETLARGEGKIETGVRPSDKSAILKGAAAQAVCYAVAIGVAVLIVSVLHDRQHPLVTILIADIAATIVVFGFSFALGNSSLYDPYWSVQPVVIAAFWWWWPTTTESGNPQRIVVTALVLVWAIRLTGNFFYGWQGLAQQDWRYVNLQQTNGRAYWLVSLTGIHLFPTLLVYLGCLPLMHALNPGDKSWTLLDTVAAAIMVIGILLETIADAQLHRFVRTNREPGKTLDTGLWAWSRHPNYLGEILFWWGLALFGHAAGGPWWAWSGAVAISLLFKFASIPMMEKRSHERRTDYGDYCRRVPKLFPFFRSRISSLA